MSHEVETMAFAHETPWHGLGTRVDSLITVDDMLEAAGLNWEVERVPIYTGDNRDEAIPEHVCIRRATDKHVYDIVSPRWKPVQNREILNFFRQWTEAGDATLETAGSLRNGKQVWALANLKNGFVLPGGDAVKGYVLLVGSHESGKATIAKPTGVRVVCANTMAMALSSKSAGEVRINHLNEFNIEDVKLQMGLHREAITAFEKAAKTLQKLKLDMETITDTLVPIFQPGIDEDKLDAEEFGPTLTNILWAMEKAPGAVGKTGWGVFNGVTYALDHMAKTKTPDGRFYAAQLGHQAANKQKTLEALLELAS